MSAADGARLYVILGSHACRTGMLLVEHKGLPFRLVTLPTGLHPLGLRLLGFAGKGQPRELDGARRRPLALADRLGTVPALRVGGERVQTNRAIARFLDRVRPAPPLFPEDPGLRREVEEAERWGDETFQMVARRLALAAVLHGPDALHARGGAGRLGPLLWQSDRLRFLGARAVGRLAFAADSESEAKLLAGLPAMLDRIDGWIEAGVLGAAELNAADYMLVTSLALIAYRRDLRPEIEARAAGALVERVLPEPR